MGQRRNIFPFECNRSKNYNVTQHVETHARSSGVVLNHTRTVSQRWYGYKNSPWYGLKNFPQVTYRSCSTTNTHQFHTTSLTIFPSDFESHVAEAFVVVCGMLENPELTENLRISTVSSNWQKRQNPGSHSPPVTADGPLYRGNAVFCVPLAQFPTVR